MYVCKMTEKNLMGWVIQSFLLIPIVYLQKEREVGVLHLGQSTTFRTKK